VRILGRKLYNHQSYIPASLTTDNPPLSNITVLSEIYFQVDAEDFAREVAEARTPSFYEQIVFITPSNQG
jgi:UDP-3-O-acyl-N-acetylglucosamine deacetylase